MDAMIGAAGNVGKVPPRCTVREAKSVSCASLETTTPSAMVRVQEMKAGIVPEAVNVRVAVPVTSVSAKVASPQVLADLATVALGSQEKPGNERTRKSPVTKARCEVNWKVMGEARPANGCAIVRILCVRSGRVAVEVWMGIVETSGNPDCEAVRAV